MKDIFAIGFLALVCIVGWKLGEHMSTDALTMCLGVIFGLMAGIPAALMVAQRGGRVRHDHYVHPSPPVRAEPQNQPLQLPARPTRYTVIANRASLPTVAQSKLEASK